MHYADANADINLLLLYSRCCLERDMPEVVFRHISNWPVAVFCVDTFEGLLAVLVYHMQLQRLVRLV
jgi:hypothetical protein